MLQDTQLNGLLFDLAPKQFLTQQHKHPQTASRLRHPVVGIGITARRSSFPSRHPHTPAAREGSEKNPERLTDVSQTTARETSYKEDEDFSKMWQPTSERLQVCVNMWPATEESERFSWKTRKKRGFQSGETLGFLLQLQMFSQHDLSHGLYLTCSTAVFGGESGCSWYHITHIDNTVLPLTFQRIANTHWIFVIKTKVIAVRQLQAFSRFNSHFT